MMIIIFQTFSFLNVQQYIIIGLIDEINRTAKGKLILVGDFNFSCINWENWTTKSSALSSDYRFLSCLRDKLLNQHKYFLIRGRGSNAPDLLDLVISNG